MTGTEQPVRTAHRIASEDEAVAVASVLAERFAREAVQRDRDRVLPAAELDELSDAGLLAVTVPRAHGGAGISTLGLVRIVALLSAADPSIGQIPQNHFAGIEGLRVERGEARKAFFYDRILRGDRLGNASAEPGDLAPTEHRTRIRRDGDRYRLDGRKVYSTGALFAHWVPVSATDADGVHHSAFVPRDAPGLTVVDDWSGFGQRTTASGTVLLDGVLVDALHVAATRRGDPTPTSVSPVSQIYHAAVDLGIARAALDDTLVFLRTTAHAARGSGVAHATEDPIAVRDVGELTVAFHAAEALLERAARAVDRARATDDPDDAAGAHVAVAEAKILTTTVALDTSNRLFELAGTQSTLQVHGLDRHWRNARTHTLHDGVRWKYHAVGNYELNGLLADQWTLGHPYTPWPPRGRTGDAR
ncbi:SfnB family sulfur acquisition oxidoreductase [Pseudonocardia endophytica]|uniref:Dibenzothiophene monooxygenase n=1 Tax=Pseudonocardia endophytica TaxID=401976 RepID=A0A4R1HUE4_PSEEN|nr:SfnB family sulfur acquisition oxidoreductase [Pseudonocardia endophytica]TCK26317.1 SfnB family sulfur acquisition oxidoreductase [Pseudonocardia endophytica]